MNCHDRVCRALGCVTHGGKSEYCFPNYEKHDRCVRTWCSSESRIKPSRREAATFVHHPCLPWLLSSLMGPALHCHLP